METICTCDGFVYWYSEKFTLIICQCGHSLREHLDDVKSCIGTVVGHETAQAA